MSSTFFIKDKLNSHIIQCKKVDPQRTEFPNNKNKFVIFINFKNKIPAAFAVYADFEAFNKDCDKLSEEPLKLKRNGKPKEKQSTEKIADQEICSYGNKLVCYFDD